MNLPCVYICIIIRGKSNDLLLAKYIHNIYKERI